MKRQKHLFDLGRCEIHLAKPVRERGIGFVFQHYALFRHMTVFENIAFGLRVRPRGSRPSEDEIRKGIQGNLCRCTGYVNIVEAIKAASGT